VPSIATSKVRDPAAGQNSSANLRVTVYWPLATARFQEKLWP
jgi:hypothetical protein